MTDASHTFWVEKCKEHYCAFQSSCLSTCKRKPSTEHDDFFRSHLCTFRNRQASQQLQQSAEGQQSICEGLRQRRWHEGGQVPEERDYVSSAIASLMHIALRKAGFAGLP